MKDGAKDHTQTEEFTADELRQKRRVAAMRTFLTSLRKGDVASDSERLLYATSIKADLLDEERLGLLWLLLDTFPPDYMEWICQQWFIGKGMPGAALIEDPMADANFWASDANGREHKAYAVACFNRMSPKSQTEFIEWAQKKAGLKPEAKPP